MQEGLPSSSMNLLRRVPNTPKSYHNPQTSTKSSNSNTLFYTYACSQKKNAAPSAIVHFGTCASVVGKVTLDHALDVLGIQELRDDKILQREHQFRLSDKSPKTLCAVRVPFRFGPSKTRDPIRFDIRLDVIDGDLPFLTGLPSLKAMGVRLNFRYNNLSLIVHQNIYRLDLIKHAWYLRKPLASKCSS